MPHVEAGVQEAPNRARDGRSNSPLRPPRAGPIPDLGLSGGDTATGLGTATGLAFAPDGKLFVGDRSGSILRIGPDRDVETYASIPASMAAFHLAMGPDNCLYVTAPTLATHDAIYRITPDRLVDVVNDRLGRPQGLAFDSTGALYVVDALAGASGLYRIDVRQPGAEPELVLSAPSLVGVAFDPDGGLVLASAETVWRLECSILDANYKPQSFLNETTKELDGFDIDVSKEVAKRLGVKVEFVPVTSANRIPQLLSGRVDMLICLFGITPERDVVAYCRIGERSSLTWFVLKYLLGYPYGCIEQTSSKVLALSGLRGLIKQGMIPGNLGEGFIPQAIEAGIADMGDGQTLVRTGFSDRGKTASRETRRRHRWCLARIRRDSCCFRREATCGYRAF